MNFPKINTLKQNIEELEHSQHSRSSLHVTLLVTNPNPKVISALTLSTINSFCLTLSTVK